MPKAAEESDIKDITISHKNGKIIEIAPAIIAKYAKNLVILIFFRLSIFI